VVIPEGGGRLEWSNKVPYGKHGWSINIPFDDIPTMPPILVDEPKTDTIDVVSDAF